MASYGDKSCGLTEDLFWGIYIDGKDAEKGPEAYAWDPDFHTTPLKTVHFLHDTFSVGENSSLTLNHINDIHKTCCGMFEERHSTSVGNTLNCVPLIESCELRMQGIKNVDPALIKFKGKPDANGCYKSYTRKNPSPIKKYTAQLLETYNGKIQKSTTADEKLLALANFQRNFAWLHPWKGGNGRMRNFILQREIRRLGLGCGAMMYNNNRDIFFETDERYAAKISEGIAVYKESARTKKNAWQLKTFRDRHLQDFSWDKQMQSVCVMKREKLGSILRAKVDEE